MNRFIHCVAWVVLMLAAARAAAEAPNADCDPANEEALRGKFATAVSKLRIAQAHADLALMDQNERELGRYEKCDSMFDRLCDAECQIQRAAVHLFRATAIPLLATKSLPVSSGIDQTLIDEAEKGIQLVDQALGKLPRQRGFHAVRADPGAPQPADEDAGFNSYLKSYCALAATRAKLQMAAGDVHYRSASTARDNALSYFVSEVIDGVAGNAAQENDELRGASRNYENAYWTLLEAQTSLPNDAASGTLFGAELNQVYFLREQIGQRIQSLREGKLYIGIDAYGLGSEPGAETANNLHELMTQLQKQKGNLAKLEDEQGSVMQQWAAKVEEIAGNDEQLASLQNSRSIDLEAFKMQAVDRKTEELTKDVLAQISKIEAGQAQYEIQAQIAAVEAQFEQDKRSFNNDLSAISHQNEEDMISAARDRDQLELDRIRGAIDATLADFNFQMQKDALIAQQKDLVTKRDLEKKEQRIIAEQVKQANADIENHKLEQTNLDLEIKSARERQAKVLDEQKSALESDAKATDQEISFYEKDVLLIPRICAQRKKLEDDDQLNFDKIKQCLEGVGDGCDASLKQTYEDILSNKKQGHDIQKTKALAIQGILSARLVDVSVTLIAWVGAQTVKAAAAEAVRVAEAAAALPEVTTGTIMGMPVALVTEGGEDVAAAAKSAAGAAFEIANSALEVIQGKETFAQTVSELAEHLQDVAADIRQVDLDEKLAELEKQQAMVELSVRFRELQQGKDKSINEAAVQKLECEQQGNQSTSALARLREQRASIDANSRALDGERGLLEYPIKQNTNRITQEGNAITIGDSRIAELDIARQKSELSFATYEELIKDLDKQIAEVDSYRRKVTDLQQRVDEVQAKLTAHVEEFLKVQTDANADQREFVLASLKSADDIHLQALDKLQHAFSAQTELAKLNEKVVEIDKSAREEIKKHSEAIASLMKAAPIPKLNDVIWDFEDLQAKLLRGAADIIEDKRIVLDNINYYYNSYRYRYNVLSEFVGKSWPQEAEPYIWTSQDAKNKLAQCIQTGDNEICAPSSLANDPIAISGKWTDFAFSTNSPLLRTLQRDHRVRFEISSFAASRADSAALGDFVLWDELTMGMLNQEEGRLLGFFMTFPTLNRCLPTISIKHLGIGYQMKSLGGASQEVVPSMVVRRAVSAPITVFTPGNNADFSGAIKTRKGKFTVDPITIKQLDAKGGAEVDTIMPFLGYPVLGSYEMSVTSTTQECLDEILEATLVVLFAARS